MKTTLPRAFERRVLGYAVHITRAAARRSGSSGVAGSRGFLSRHKCARTAPEPVAPPTCELADMNGHTAEEEEMPCDADLLKADFEVARKQADALREQLAALDAKRDRLNSLRPSVRSFKVSARACYSYPARHTAHTLEHAGADCIAMSFCMSPPRTAGRRQHARVIVRKGPREAVACLPQHCGHACAADESARACMCV
eukprot:5224409-Pleurochrysis_carterae.AAC.1